MVNDNFIGTRFDIYLFMSFLVGPDKYCIVTVLLHNFLVAFKINHELGLPVV